MQRVTGVPMEPRTTTAEYDAATGNYTLYAGSGRGVAKLRLDLAQVLGVPAEQVRCVCQDMGGNFGTRNFFYPEYALLAWAARRVGRPVKWTCERSEAFLSDYQGRDLTVVAELALDKEGNFLAVRGSNLSNLGGHAAAFVSLQKGLGLMSNVYRIPVGYFLLRFTPPPGWKLLAVTPDCFFAAFSNFAWSKVMQVPLDPSANTRQ